jgi:hypothetical protein
MGCDIHLVVERRRRDGRWERVLPPEEARDPCLVQNDRRRALFSWYDGRNYALFAILADVRNYGGYLHPISSPRGLPPNIAPESRLIEDYTLRVDDDDVFSGDHSFSWLTLAELQAYRWTRPVVRTGVISLEEFAGRLASGDESPPTSYCRSVSPTNITCPPSPHLRQFMGPQTETISETEAASRLRRGGVAVAAGHKVYVEIAWNETPAELAGDFYTRVMPALAKLGTPDNVRIVFGFDS